MDAFWGHCDLKYVSIDCLNVCAECMSSDHGSFCASAQDQTYFKQQLEAQREFPFAMPVVLSSSMVLFNMGR